MRERKQSFHPMTSFVCASVAVAWWLIVGIGASGCLGPRQAGTVAQQGPIINVPASEQVNTGALENRLKQTISASANSTQNQLSGLITASVSKLGERVTGMETNLSELFKLNMNMVNTASADVRTKLESTVNASNEMRAELNNILQVSNKLQTEVTALTNLNVRFGEINNSLSAVANGQMGFNNRLEQKFESMRNDMKAGRDVNMNMLPKNAVDIMLGSWKAFVVILLILSVVVTTVICLAFKFSRDRESQRTQMEREERKNLYKLLLEVLALVPEQHAEQVQSKIQLSQAQEASLET